jgi:hypothetical protein
MPNAQRPTPNIRKELKYLLLRNVLTPPACHFLRFYGNLLRFQVEGGERFLSHLAAGGRIVFACWHQRFFGGFYFPALFERSPYIMISQSRDGDFIADAVRRIGWRPVRGSGSREGRKALREMVDLVTGGEIGVHIVDGPNGPPRIVKPGLITLAQRTGSAVCLGLVAYEDPWVFNSWDRFMVPKPFSGVLIRLDRLEPVPERMDREEFEECRKRIEDSLVRGYEEADKYWSREENREGARRLSRYKRDPAWSKLIRSG